MGYVGKEPKAHGARGSLLHSLVPARGSCIRGPETSVRAEPPLSISCQGGVAALGLE